MVNYDYAQRPHTGDIRAFIVYPARSPGWLKIQKLYCLFYSTALFACWNLCLPKH